MSFWECDECGLWYCSCHPRPDTKGAAMRDVIDIGVDGYEEVVDRILKLKTKEN